MLSKKKSSLIDKSFTAVFQTRAPPAKPLSFPKAGSQSHPRRMRIPSRHAGWWDVQPGDLGGRQRSGRTSARHRRHRRFQESYKRGRVAGFRHFCRPLGKRPRYGVNHMLRTTTLLAAITLLGLPRAAQAQAPTSSAADLSYCAKLSDICQRYLGPEKSGHIDTTPNVVGGEAVAKCQAGDAAASIPVLERLLTNGGFTLPRQG